MNKTVKIILGIVIGLVAVAVLAGLGYLAYTWWGGSHWMMGTRLYRPFEGGRVLPWREMPLMPFGRTRLYPFGGFSVIRILAGSLIWLGILALIVLGVVALVRGLRRPVQSMMASSQAMPATTLSATETAQAPARICPNCGRTVEDSWSHCPYCGTSQG